MEAAFSREETAIVENEYRVIGPPGTGKTTYLCRQVEAAVKAACSRDDTHPSECRAVLMASLTKAAANEIRGRGLDLPNEQVATLHAHAYRALGRPTLCVDGAPLAEWNEHCVRIGEPSWKLSGIKEDAPDQTPAKRINGSKNGDTLLQEYHFRRSRLQEPRTDTAKRFTTKYEEWKHENEYLDFSDVIHDAYFQTDSAPYRPSVIMVDEAQDNDRAELRLIRKWAKAADKVVVVGDPDQNLYEWRGSEPEAFFDVQIPPENNRVLSQSYRVPRAVHARAMEMIGRIKSRRPIEYNPRDYEGEAIESDVYMTGRCADEAIVRARRYLDNGKRVMFLASCEYMLAPLISELKSQGIPFWNPFARQRGRMNPLHPAKGVSAGTRVLNYLLPQEKYFGGNSRLWTWGELHTWVDVCQADGLLKHGMKAEIGRRAKSDDGPLSFHDVAECFDQSIVDAMDADAIALLKRFVRKDRKATIDFALTILRRRGVSGLEETPQVVVGTIHSVKGGEADVVFVAPDLSPQGHEEYESSGCDAIFRLFYVAMTRAKETLILCSPGNRMCIDW